MIQELVEFGKRVTKGNNLAFVEVPFSIDLVINENGEFVRFITGERKGILSEVITAKKGKARFLLDKAEETLGIGDEKKHKLYLNKIEQYKEVPSLKPVLLFYDSNNPKGLKLAQQNFEELDKKVKGENITFMVNTTRLLNKEDVKNAIEEHFKKKESKSSSGKVCSICGKSTNPVLDEPHGVVKMPKGQTAGSTLVSYNENAFESYGLKGNLNSSICTECARNYKDGLDFLLRDGYEVVVKDKKKYPKYHHRYNISDDTVALFWTKKEIDDFDPSSVIDVPDEKEVQNLLKSVWKGDEQETSIIDTNMFYSCTMSTASKSRIAVRDWTAISLDQYKHNLAEWFKDIEIDKEGTKVYSPLRMLINATQKDKKSGEQTKSDLASKARIGSILWNAVIKSRSYRIPDEVLQYALNRIFIGDHFSTSKAALIRLIINRNTTKNMEPKLNPDNRSIAYLCGRMFAVIETMQWKAMGNVNSGVKDRYFAAAAAQPASILGSLLTKNVPIYQHKIGGYMAKELNEIAGKVSEMGRIPNRFSTIEQAEFAMGYYFQKNHKANSEEDK